jgi:hypothetical protein
LTIPTEVHELVERFDRNVDDYKRGKYNETQVRREFIDPFFKAIGWDVDNTKGYAEAYKEVVHEDAIKMGTAQPSALEQKFGTDVSGAARFTEVVNLRAIDARLDDGTVYIKSDASKTKKAREVPIREPHRDVFIFRGY